MFKPSIKFKEKKIIKLVIILVSLVSIIFLVNYCNKNYKIIYGDKEKNISAYFVNDTTKIKSEWTKRIFSNSDDFAYSDVHTATSTSDGGVIVGGYFRGVIDKEDGNKLTTSGTDTDMLLIKYKNSHRKNGEPMTQTN